MSDGPKGAEQAKRYDGFFVDDVDFVADCGDGQTGAGGENGGFGGEGRAGERVDDGLGLGFGVSVAGDVGLLTSGNNGDGGKSSGGKEGRTDTGGACWV